MRAIEYLILALQVALLLVCAWTVAVRRPTAGRPKPIWSSLTISTLIAAMASFGIADRHATDAVSELIRFGGAILVSLALAFALVSLRERRGLDQLA